MHVLKMQIITLVQQSACLMTNFTLISSIFLILWLGTFQLFPHDGGPLLMGYLLLSVIFLLRRSTWIHYKPTVFYEKLWLFIIFCYLLIIVLGTWQSGVFSRASARAIDNPSRYLLWLPVLFAWRQVRIAPRVFTWGLIAAGSGIFTGILIKYLSYPATSRLTLHTFTISLGQIVAVLSVCIAFTAWYWWKKNQIVHTLLCLSAACMTFFVVIINGSRGAIMGFIGAMMMFLILVWKYSRLQFFVIMGVTGLVAGVIFVTLAEPQKKTLSSAIDRTFYTLQNYWHGNKTANPNDLRLLIWEASLKLSQQYPLGVGSDRFGIALRALAQEDAAYLPVQRFNHAHNEYLNILVENGWPGLCALLALLGYSGWLFAARLLQHQLTSPIDFYAGCGLLLIVCYTLFALTQGLFSHHAPTIFFVVMLYLCMAQMRAWSADDA